MNFKFDRAVKAFALLAVSAGSLSLAAGTANAQDLLKSSNARETLAVEKSFKADKTLKRMRLVEIDTAIMEKQILPKGAEKAANRAERSAKLAGEVTLQLFSDVTVTLKARHVESAFNGGVVWNAGAGGSDYGILVVNNGKVTGSVEYKGRSYLIEPAGQWNTHRVREVDSEAFPNDIHMPIAKDAKAAGGKPNKGGGGTGGGGTGGGGTITPPAGTILEINLLGAYTALAYTKLGGVPADKIALDVAIVNQGYANSSVPLHLNLVGVAAVSASYNERGYSDSAQPLLDITSGTGFNFSAIRSQRTTLAADLVTIYVDRPEYCGVAWVNSSLSSSYAFSAINAACNGTASLAHELGHNMALRHDRYVEAAASSSVYNYGFVSTAGRFRDIMAYNNQCTALGYSCTRITYYSTPAKTYNGYTIGIPAGTAGAADATRKLAEGATAVSAFR